MSRLLSTLVFSSLFVYMLCSDQQTASAQSGETPEKLPGQNMINSGLRKNMPTSEQDQASDVPLRGQNMINSHHNKQRSNSGPKTAHGTVPNRSRGWN